MIDVPGYYIKYNDGYLFGPYDNLTDALNDRKELNLESSLNFMGERYYDHEIVLVTKDIIEGAKKLNFERICYKASKLIKGDNSVFWFERR